MTPTPVVLFAYKRPDHLQRALEGLRQNRVPLIYAFSDGPRSPDVEPLVTQVRQILRSVDWCAVHITERETNLGLGTSVRTGVSEVLANHGRVLVVEDDIVLQPGAYGYAVAALDHYQQHASVMSISLWSDPSLVPAGERVGFFSRRFVCWGWATTREHWLKYDRSPLELYRACEQKGLNVLSWGQDLKWQAENAEARNLWYVGFALTHFLHGGVCYFPVESLSDNVGFDGSGENCSIVAQAGEHTDAATAMVAVPERWPKVRVPRHEDRRFAAYFAGFRPEPVPWRDYARRFLGPAYRPLRSVWKAVRAAVRS